MKALALVFILLLVGIVYTARKIVTALKDENNGINLSYLKGKAPEQLPSNALYLFWCLPD